MKTATKTDHPFARGAQGVIDAIEALAPQMADANSVEEAWFLRGIADGLAVCLKGEEPEGGAGPYGRDYRRGFGAVTRFFG